MACPSAVTAENGRASTAGCAQRSEEVPMPARFFRRILVPHDFSPQAPVARKAAAVLPPEPRARLTVLPVIVPFYVPADMGFGLAAESFPAPTTFVPEQRKRLETLVAKALRGRETPVTCKIDVGDASMCIL